MKRKTLVALLSGMGLVGALGAAQIASAHGFGGFMMSVTPEEIATRQQAMFAQQAQILGASVDEVKNAWAEGKSFFELAKEKNITEDQLAAKMKELRLAEMKTQLQALVTKGIITQAQADKRLEVMQSRSATMGRGMGKMMRGGFGF